MKKTPIIGYRISLSDLLSGVKGFFSGKSKDEFHDVLSGFVQSGHVYFTNSGISAFYIVLLALKRISARREVVLPAYTAPSLVVAVKKAGLKPVLCDISLKDFNMDTHAAAQRVSPETLCVVCVHMFGIPAMNIEQLKYDLPEDVFLMEDCAQAMGSKIGDRPVGGFGDFGVFSFNRGKNLPTYGGGAIFTNSGEPASAIEDIADELRTPASGHEISLFLKFICLSIAFRPVFYSLIYPFISHFKEDKVPTDFIVEGYTSLQARLGTVLFERFGESCMKRYENAVTVISGLKNTGGIILPGMQDNVFPAFNRLPIVFENTELRGKVEKEFIKNGIGVSGLYFKPLHHVFGLGYGKDEFPNAVYLAERLLTLPSHPLVSEGTLKKMIELIGSIVS